MFVKKALRFALARRRSSPAAKRGSQLDHEGPRKNRGDFIGPIEQTSPQERKRKRNVTCGECEFCKRGGEKQFLEKKGFRRAGHGGTKKGYVTKFVTEAFDSRRLCQSRSLGLYRFRILSRWSFNDATMFQSGVPKCLFGELL